MLKGVAGDAGIPYISPLGDGWIKDDPFEKTIDTKTGHPSTEGHAILAKLVVSQLRKMVD